jgi:hypothetical protein
MIFKAVAALVVLVVEEMVAAAAAAAEAKHVVWGAVKMQETARISRLGRGGIKMKRKIHLPPFQRAQCLKPAS